MQPETSTTQEISCINKYGLVLPSHGLQEQPTLMNQATASQTIKMIPDWQIQAALNKGAGSLVGVKKRQISEKQIQNGASQTAARDPRLKLADQTPRHIGASNREYPPLTLNIHQTRNIEASERSQA